MQNPLVATSLMQNAPVHSSSVILPRDLALYVWGLANVECSFLPLHFHSHVGAPMSDTNDKALNKIAGRGLIPQEALPEKVVVWFWRGSTGDWPSAHFKSNGLCLRLQLIQCLEPLGGRTDLVSAECQWLFTRWIPLFETSVVSVWSH